MNWREKLDKFLNDFKYKDDVIGVLACGSYITGKPTSHSDLDVHIILKKDCDYRLRTTKFVDGVLKDNHNARKVYEKWGGKLDEYTQPFVKLGVSYDEVFYTYDLTKENNLKGEKRKWKNEI